MMPTPAYSVDTWVNREEEVQFVLSLLGQLFIGQPITEHIVVFQGERGTGKSWLLRRLAQQLAHYQPGYARTVLPLIDLAQFHTSDPGSALNTILDELTLGLGHALPREHELSWKTRLCYHAIRDQAGQMPVVLLVDTVYEADPNLVEQLEDALLTPFARLPNVLLIMAGRGVPFPWRDIVLRVTKIKFWSLKPFNSVSTQRQLEKQCLPSPDILPIDAARIQAITGGNPASNYHIGLVDETRLGEALDRTINDLLEVIRDEALRQRVRDYLEHLCVLKFGFMVDEIGILMDKTPGESRKILRELTQMGLVHLKTEQDPELEQSEPGYVMGETMRNLIDHYIQREKPTLWTDMHYRAWQLYASWQTKYPDESYMYQAQVDYHKDRCDAMPGRE